MLSRSSKIALAVVSIGGLFVATVAANARLSWQPVVVDFSSPFPVSQPQHLPSAWRGNDLWLLSGERDTVSGKSSPTPWKQVRNWNRSSFQVVQTATHDEDLLALNPTNGEFARTDGDDQDPGVQLWRGKKVRLHLRESGHRNHYGVMHSRRPTLMAFSPDGTRLITNSYLYGWGDHEETLAGFCNYGAVLFDAKSGKQLARPNAFEGCFSDFAWSPDSKEVAAIAVDGWAFVFDGSTGKGRLKFRAHSALGAQIAWSPDGKTLVTASNPRVGVALPGIGFAFKSGGDVWARTGSMEGTNSSGTTVLTSKFNGEASLNGRTERLLKRFDARTGKQIGTPLPLETGAVDLAFSPDGKQLAVGEHNFALVLDADTLATERRLVVPSTSTPAKVALPVCVAWSPDGATLATATQTGLVFWRAK